MQAAVQVTSSWIFSTAELCILQQNVKFHSSTEIEAEPNFTVNSWKKELSGSFLNLSHPIRVGKLILFGLLV